jgi:hypothetical protein
LGFANAHLWEVNTYTSDNRAGQTRAAEAAAIKALKLAPDSADAHVTHARRLAPNFTIAKFRGEVVSDNPVYLAQREYFIRASVWRDCRRGERELRRVRLSGYPAAQLPGEAASPRAR